MINTSVARNDSVSNKDDGSERSRDINKIWVNERGEKGKKRKLKLIHESFSFPTLQELIYQPFIFVEQLAKIRDLGWDSAETKSGLGSDLKMLKRLEKGLRWNHTFSTYCWEAGLICNKLKVVMDTDANIITLHEVCDGWRFTVQQNNSTLCQQKLVTFLLFLFFFLS